MADEGSGESRMDRIERMIEDYKRRRAGAHVCGETDREVDSMWETVKRLEGMVRGSGPGLDGPN